MTSGHILLTTYQSVRIYKHLLLPREWGYVILDEGHKIRNPGWYTSFILSIFVGHYYSFVFCFV
jgi:superfamily II DNA or RNA helicase